jgi:hypothetical protein
MQMELKSEKSLKKFVRSIFTVFCSETFVFTVRYDDWKAEEVKHRDKGLHTVKFSGDLTNFVQQCVGVEGFWNGRGERSEKLSNLPPQKKKNTMESTAALDRLSGEAAGILALLNHDAAIARADLPSQQPQRMAPRNSEDSEDDDEMPEVLKRKMQRGHVHHQQTPKMEASLRANSFNIVSQHDMTASYGHHGPSSTTSSPHSSPTLIKRRASGPYSPFSDPVTRSPKPRLHKFEHTASRLGTVLPSPDSSPDLERRNFSPSLLPRFTNMKIATSSSSNTIKSHDDSDAEGEPCTSWEDKSTIIMAENARLNRINGKLMLKLERAYEQLLQVKAQPEKLTSEKSRLRSVHQLLSQQLATLIQENEALQQQLSEAKRK